MQKFTERTELELRQHQLFMQWWACVPMIEHDRPLQREVFYEYKALEDQLRVREALRKRRGRKL
jgi:hypothetical protein